jgi:LysR family transcriptional regulator, benzoate and cis,cis-muconate-responsive activator of ben and cat genes
MDTRQIKNFLILCETLNFRKASGQINIVQPALSRQMQLLEKEATRILQDLNKTIIRAAQLQELRRFITMF